MRKSRYLIIAFGIFLSTVSIAQDNGLSFDGIDDFVEFNSNPVFSSVRTFEAWIYPTSTTGFKTISEWSDGVDNDLRFYMNNNRLELSEFDGIQSGSVTGTGTITANQWNHIAFVETVSGYIFYIDGVADPVGFSAATAGLTPIFNLGSIRSGFNYFEGIIDEVRVWNAELNQATIESQRFSELTGAEPNLIAYYQFNESSGTVLPDLTSNALDGTLLNGLANTPPADGITNGPLWVASSALPDPFIVTNTNNTGIGSLRWCIGNANATAGPNEITFDATLTGLTISLASSLTITSGNGDGTTIDGDIDGNGTPDITIVPGGTNFDGIIITASNCTLKSLHMKDFTSGIYSAIHVRNSTATNNKIIGCRLGVTADGTTTDGATIGQAIQIRDGADGTLIGDGTEAGANVIGNSATGIIMWFSAVNTVVSGNYIGISLNGSDVGNDYGIRLFNNTVANTKIGVAGAMPNIISYNNRPIRSEGISTTIINNYIGTDRTGLLARGNTGTIVIHLNNSKDSNVGDGTTAGRNIIAGNANAAAIHLQNATDNTRIYGNYIGIGADGSTTLANGSGIKIDVTPTNTFIGNGTVQGRNIISSSTGFSLNGQGIYAAGPSTTIQGNFIGTDATGTLNRGNNQSGILLAGSFTGTVGGTVAGQENLISGNSDGIKIQVSGVNILGNYIGTDVTGTLAIPNTNEGIWLDTNGANTIIGDGTAAGANIIAFNPTGILASGATVQNNIWTQNSIYSNGTGISIASGAQGGVIPPIITNIAPDGTISGTSGLFADIEVYFDSVDQGEYYYGTASADAAGIWSVSGSLASIPPGLTFATAIQLDLGNSSAFSPPFALPVPAPFITTWQTDILGTTANNQVYITTSGTGYNYDIYWEEVGNEATNNGTEPTGQTGAYTITFPSPGTYRVHISGNFPRIRFGVFDKNKLLTVEQWGDQIWTSMRQAFDGCTNLNITATDAPDLTLVTDMSRMFMFCANLNADLNNWDVSNVANMSDLFNQATTFNGDISGWDVSNVTTMEQMFWNAPAFNQNISAWNVSSVTSMRNMFISATSFNQNIGSWNVNNVTDMYGMFGAASAFDQDISSWNVTGVTAMASMFSGASSFNQPIGGWDVSAITDMSAMFANASVFNQDLSAWDVSNVTNMISMFAYASSFNGNISAWDVSAVSNMSGMFWEATSFDQPLDLWNVGSVTTMAQMFEGASTFNQPLNNWDVSSATNLQMMFKNAPNFNQDISGWNLSNVISTREMFLNATSFDQNLGGWDIQLVSFMSNMFDNSGLSVTNYDATLIGWDALPTLQSGITLGAAGLNYCAAETARNNIISTYGWTITGDILNCAPANPFITTWQTNNPGTTSSTQITIPTNSGETYSYDIYWEEIGDPTHFGTLNGQTGNAIIEFGSIGIYQVQISGVFPHFYSNNSGDGSKLLTVEMWGDIQWKSMYRAFDQCDNLRINAPDAPDLSVVTDMREMFSGAASFNDDISFWDVSNITDMSLLFYDASSFNQPLNTWNVSNVTNMAEMFVFASSFNQPLTAWDVGNVTSMSYMFSQASAFNQPLNNWDVSNVIDMSGMFAFTADFNQPLDNWNVASVTAMDWMFTDNSVFDQNLGTWNIANVTDMANMLRNTGLSIANYDATLIGWNSLTILEPNVTLGSTGLEYCAAISARDNLINTHGWIITGDTENCGACASPPTANAGTDLTIDEGNTAPLAGTIGGSATTLTWTTAGDGSFNDNMSASAVYTPGSADIANGSVNLTMTTDDPDGAGPCVAASDDLVLTIIPASTNTFNIFEGAEISGNPISVGQTNIDVGSTPVGLDLDSDFTIENNQLTTLNISAITSTDPAFEVLNVPANVLPGNTEVFTIRLVATEVGVFNTNIVITSDFAPFNFSMVGEVTATEPGTITVYNAVSPNGDGMHDYLEIAGIELFSLNRVAVMNRWGDIVYEASGYDNNNVRFEGISNNGSELPTGTYFYQIDLGDGSDMISGFISLRK